MRLRDTLSTFVATAMLVFMFSSVSVHKAQAAKFTMNTNIEVVDVVTFTAPAEGNDYLIEVGYMDESMRDIPMREIVVYDAHGKSHLEFEPGYAVMSASSQSYKRQ